MEQAGKQNSQFSRHFSSPVDLSTADEQKKLNAGFKIPLINGNFQSC
jgi:hypothetical protein